VECFGPSGESRSSYRERTFVPELFSFRLHPRAACSLVVILLLVVGIQPASMAAGNEPQPFTIDLTAPQADVLKAVHAVVEDDVIHGTYVYEREQTLMECVSEPDSSFFGEYKGNGHVFYKVKHDALAPRNFKDSADIGVITVQYVVAPVSAMRTHLAITAVFVEDGSKHVHLSNTTVETSEFAEIQAQLVSIQRERQQTAEILKKRELSAQATSIAKERNAEAVRVKSADTSLSGLEQRADQLQHQVEVRVVNPSTELKSAPFHSATSVGTIPAGSDVLVEIITEYWYGVETADGHRGWLRRDEVAPLP
jgi:hypothetical protein